MKISILDIMEANDDNPLNDDKLKADLYAMSESDPDGFMEEILQVLKSFPEFILSDNAPVENKTNALNRMMKHFENLQRYEDCAFVKNQLTKLDAR